MGVRFQPSVDCAAATDPSVADVPADAPAYRRLLHERGAEGLILLAVFLVRLAMGIRRQAPRFYPDEFASFAMARWMSGTGTWQMFDLNTYAPGVSILMAPLYWVTNDSSVLLRVVIVGQSLVAVASVLVLARLVQRITSFSRLAALLTSATISVAPASVGKSAAAWGEPLVTLIVLLTICALFQFYDQPRLSSALYPVGLSILGMTVHSRLLPLVPTVALAVGYRFLIDRRLRDAAITTATSAGLALGSLWFSRTVVRQVWDGENDNHTVGGVIKRLADPLLVVDSLVGQTWYQLAATLGLAGIGTAAVFAACTGRSIGGYVRLAQRDARLIALVIAPLFSLSVLFMTNRERIDQAVYGRYNDAVFWPILALGVAWLAGQARAGFTSIERESLWLIGGTFAALMSTALYLTARGAVASEGPLNEDMVIGVTWLSPTSRPVDVIPITVAATILMGFTILTVRNRVGFRVLTPFVVCLILILEVSQVYSHTKGDGWGTHDYFEEVMGDPLEPGDRVTFRFSEDNTLIPIQLQWEAAVLLQWYLPDIEIVRDSGRPTDEATYVFAAINDEALLESGAERIWTNERTYIALFRRPQATSLS